FLRLSGRKEAGEFGALEGVAAAAGDERGACFKRKKTPPAEPCVRIIRHRVDDAPGVRRGGPQLRQTAEVQGIRAPADPPDDPAPAFAREHEPGGGGGEKDVSVERVGLDENRRMMNAESTH